MDPLQNPSVVRFGTFEISFQSGEVRKAGMRIKVQQQPLKVLEILIKRRGEVVTREQLRNQVWPAETFGDFDQAVNIAIGKLRSALGDSAESPQFIETIPKRGYRFIAEVTFLDGDGRVRAEPSSSDPSGSELAARAGGIRSRNRVPRFRALDGHVGLYSVSLRSLHWPLLKLGNSAPGTPARPVYDPSQYYR